MKVDVDPAAGSDALRPAAGLEAPVSERGAELVALLSGEAELGGAGGVEVATEVDFRGQDNAVRKWYHAPWLPSAIRTQGRGRLGSLAVRSGSSKQLLRSSLTGASRLRHRCAICWTEMLARACASMHVSSI